MKMIVATVALCAIFSMSVGAQVVSDGMKRMNLARGDVQSNGDGGTARPVAPPPEPTTGERESNTPSVGRLVSDDWVAAQNKLLRSMIVTLAGEQAAAAEERHEAGLSGTKILERRLKLVKQLVEASKTSH
jgi:hypothetical protein